MALGMAFMRDGLRAAHVQSRALLSNAHKEMTQLFY
jgi:hypothetical protein